MENNRIDSFLKKSINESKDHYDAEANVAKERIWNQVQLKKKRTAIPLFFRLLAAACILLFISTTVLFISNFKKQKKVDTLVELNNELENKAAINTKNTIINNESLIVAKLNSRDTVFIEKEVVVTKPIIQKEQIIDTIYIQQIVYVEKEILPESIVAIENSIPADSTYQIIMDNYETEILISNTEDLKKTKRKKFQIKFGGNQNSGNDGAIALSSKLQN